MLVLSLSPSNGQVVGIRDPGMGGNKRIPADMDCDLIVEIRFYKLFSFRLIRDTLEQRKGDCTEHAVLLSALLRTQGIPTRLVDGVVVSGGVLGYHQWIEVQIDDEGMVPADPTFGEFPASVQRLKLAEGASDPQGLMDLGMAAARILRPGTRIEVLEADRQRFKR